MQTYGAIAANGSTSICNGGSVVLNETFGMNVFNGYQWYKDGTPINGATNYMYAATQSGDYTLRLNAWCFLNFSSVDYYTNWITVTNNGGTVPTPSISAAGSTTVCAGQSVTLTESTGIGWTYQWQKNSVNIAGATNATYPASTTGNFNCVVTNICGSFNSNVIAVTVQPAAVTISLSGSSTICGGAYAPLSATSAGSGGTYQWKKNGVNIGGATQSAYAATAAGSYTCAITNPCGTLTSNAIAISVSGSCSTGLWFDGVNDRCTVPNIPSYAFGNGDFSAEVWVRLDPLQATQYVVAVSNRQSFYNSPGFAIYFNQGVPSFLTAGYPLSGTADLRDNICHHVAATRTAAGVGTLYVDGIQVATSTHPNVSLNGTTVYFGTDQYFQSYYKGFIMDVRLWNVTRTAAQIQNSRNAQLTGNETGLVGYWKLNDGSGQSVNDNSPVNNDGILGSTISVETSDPSFQATCTIAAAVNCNLPAGLTTTNITNTTAQLNWNNAAADSFMVRYAVHNTTNFVWKKFTGQPNVQSTTITGLLPATQYDWWVRSLCNSGSSSNYQAAPSTFTTSNTPVPCIVPYGSGASSIANTSATISWTTMVTADTFRVRYSKNGTTNYLWKDVNGSGGSSTTLTGLSPNQAYQFQVSSKCNGVTTAYSNSYVFTTLNTPVPCITPYNLSASNIGNTSAMISWTNLVIADTFRIRYSVNNTTNFIWKDVNGSGGSSTSLTGLTPNVSYQFQVSSKCNGVSSAYSSSFVFTTLNQPVPCIVPYGLSTTNITNNSAKVNWTNLVSADTFRIRYSINGTTNYMWKDVNGSGGTTNTTLTGLNSSSTYQWQVRTICNGVQSAYSSPILFSTLLPRDGAVPESMMEHVALYPNPAHDKALLEISAKENEYVLLTITDLTGRIISKHDLELLAGKNVTEINLEKLPRGMYLVMVSRASGSFQLKLIVE